MLHLTGAQDTLGSHAWLFTPGDRGGRSSRGAESGCTPVVSRGGCHRAAAEGGRACTRRAAACRCARSGGWGSGPVGRPPPAGAVFFRTVPLPCTEGLRSFSSHPAHRVGVRTPRAFGGGQVVESEAGPLRPRKENRRGRAHGAGRQWFQLPRGLRSLDGYNTARRAGRTCGEPGPPWTAGDGCARPAGAVGAAPSSCPACIHAPHPILPEGLWERSSSLGSGVKLRFPARRLRPSPVRGSATVGSSSMCLLK